MSGLNEIDCTQLAGIAAELALGVLTGRERAEAIMHLDRCEACREDVRQLTLTGEELLGLLPAIEPPAGFETRALEQLGLPAPGRGAGRGRAGQPLRDGRVRWILASVAVSLAVIAAGLGGWRIGATTSAAPRVQAQASLRSADLLTAEHKIVGAVFLYSPDPGWLYMSVDMNSGAGMVTCQVVGINGQVLTIGSFRLTWGHGFWGSPDPRNIGPLRDARIVSPNGTILATASLVGWLQACG